MTNNTAIRSIVARQLVDCKCRPMLEVDVITEGGAVGRGSSPTGSSVGSHEAFVMRDNDPREYDGLSVHKAVQIVQDVIGPALKGMDVMDQRALDQKLLELDPSPEKSRLGGNSIYSTSIACARAAAASRGMPLYLSLAETRGGLKHLPVPTFNMVNGGRYYDHTMPFNEFIVAPYRADSIEDAVESGIRVFKKLSSVIEHHPKGLPAGCGGSFGYIAPGEDPAYVLGLIWEAIEACGCQDKMALALDCASSEMYDKQSRTYYWQGGRISSDELIGHAEDLTRRFPLLFIEDLLDEDDWDGFVRAKQVLTRTNLIGDDFIVTNVDRLQKAYDLHAIDGFVLKPNQVGTISEAIDTFSFAEGHNMLSIPSGRSGGVVGDVIMDFAVGLGVKLLKNGAPRSGERIDKLNFLLRVASQHPEADRLVAASLSRF